MAVTGNKIRSMPQDFYGAEFLRHWQIVIFSGAAKRSVFYVPWRVGAPEPAVQPWWKDARENHGAACAQDWRVEKYVSRAFSALEPVTEK